MYAQKYPRHICTFLFTVCVTGYDLGFTYVKESLQASADEIFQVMYLLSDFTLYFLRYTTSPHLFKKEAEEAFGRVRSKVSFT